MGRELSFAVIPARFLITVGHVIALIMAFEFIPDSVYAGIGSSGNTVGKASQSLTGAIWFGLICALIDLIGLFTGMTIFFVNNNLLQIIGHFAGCLCVSWFITSTWPYYTMWNIVLITSLIPTAFEIWMFFAIFVLKVVVF